MRRYSSSLRLLIVTVFVFFLACLGCATQTLAAEFPDSGKGLTVIVDSRAKDPLYGATVRIDVGPASLSDIKQLKIGYGDSENVLLDPGKDISIQILVPSSVSAEDRAFFVQAVNETLATSIYAGRAKVREVVLDVPSLQKAMESANAELLTALEELPADINDRREIVKALVQQNKNLWSVLRDWETNFRQRMQNTLADYESRGMTFGSVAGIISSTAPVYVWLTSTGTNVFGMAQVALAILYDQLNTTFAGKLLEFENEHQIPIFKNNPLVRFYNRNTLVKALAGFRLLSWLNAPDRVASPMTFDFISTLGGVTAVGAAITAGSDVGLRQLRKKGYISGFTEILMCSAFNFMNQFNNMLLGAGQMELLQYGLGVEWSVKSIAFLTGRLLPTKGNRIAIVHPAASDYEAEQISKMVDLNDAIKANDLNLEKFREKFAALDTPSALERAKVWSADLWNRTKEGAKTFGASLSKSCAYLNAMLNNTLI